MIAASRLQRALLLASIAYASGFSVTPPHQRCHSRLHVAPLNIKLAVAKHNVLRVVAGVLLVPPDVFTTPPMLEPPARSPSENNHRQAVSALLERGWNKSDGFDIPQDDELLVNQVSKEAALPSTYGEITDLGVRQLFAYTGVKDDTDISFVDLGSGTGRLIVQAYMELSNLRCAMGVELAPSRHDIAVRAWNNVKTEAQNIRKMGQESCREAGIEFRQGDLFHADLSGATHIYIASLCFSRDMMERVAEKLAKEAKCLKCVATLKELPERFEFSFGKPKVEFVETTWTKPCGEGCAVFIYTVP